MQRTTADSFTQLRNCVERIKKNVSTARAVNAIPGTDFTFGRVESVTDKGLWYLPRYITGTTFINESCAKTQSFLEEIFGKDDMVHVPIAITVYCEPFIENHKDLSAEKKKELQDFCRKKVTSKIESNNEYIRKNLEPLLKETFPFFQKIQAEKLIQLEESESLFYRIF
jgi:hypothetical protein